MNDPATVSDHIARALRDMGTEHVFTLPSGSVGPFLKCVSAGKLEPIVTTSELSAGFMADGYARLKRAPGAAVVGGGIASLYLLPAIANARIECVPVMAMTGAPPASFSGEFSFQSSGPDGTRDASVYREAIGGSFDLSPDPVAHHWGDIIRRLEAGQPVHLTIPFDTQTRCMTVADFALSTGAPRMSDADAETVRLIAQRLLAARQPLIVFGPRVALLQAEEPLAPFLSLPHARFVTSVGAIGHLHHETPRYLGPFGFGGTQAANRAITAPECDFILFIGGRPGQRDGVMWNQRLSRSPDLLARIDASGMAKLNAPNFADMTPEPFAEVVSRLASAVSDAAPVNPARIEARSAVEPSTDLVECCITLAQEHFGDKLVAFVDSGQHRRAAIRAWRSNGQSDLHMSAEQSPMGWAIAASIGASIARRDIVTFCITGDGCMRLMGQELATAARYESRTIFLIANNSGLGSIVARADSDIEAAALGMQERVDWIAFAKTLGVAGARASDPESFKGALETASKTTGAFVIDLQLPASQRRGRIDAGEIFIGAPHAE